MTSDSERREVARTLRLMCESEIPTSDMYTLLDETDRDHQACAIALYGAVGFAVSDEPSIRKVILRLADLIDRPTCRNVSGHRDEFKCSECRCTVESLTEVCNERGEIFRVPFMPKYCPNCGAEVVDDD